jgi:hypothetical protein
MSGRDPASRGWHDDAELDVLLLRAKIGALAALDGALDLDAGWAAIRDRYARKDQPPSASAGSLYGEDGHPVTASRSPPSAPDQAGNRQPAETNDEHTSDEYTSEWTGNIP